MKNQNQFETMSFDKDFYRDHEDVEKYVALHSSIIKKLSTGETEDNDDDYPIETFVKITYANKTIYRKAIGRSSSGLNQEHIMIGYRSRKKLGIKNNTEDKVSVTKGTWFGYLWNHPDSSIRYPFIIAVLLGTISFLFSVIGLFADLRTLQII